MAKDSKFYNFESFAMLSRTIKREIFIKLVKYEC